MVARYICNSSCDIKINVNIVQNCCRNLAVRGLRSIAIKYTVAVVSMIVITYFLLF